MFRYGQKGFVSKKAAAYGQFCKTRKYYRSISGFLFYSHRNFFFYVSKKSEISAFLFPPNHLFMQKIGIENLKMWGQNGDKSAYNKNKDSATIGQTLVLYGGAEGGRTPGLLNAIQKWPI